MTVSDITGTANTKLRAWDRSVLSEWFQLILSRRQMRSVNPQYTRQGRWGKRLFPVTFLWLNLNSWSAYCCLLWHKFTLPFPAPMLILKFLRRAKSLIKILESCWLRIVTMYWRGKPMTPAQGKRSSSVIIKWQHPSSTRSGMLANEVGAGCHHSWTVGTQGAEETLASHHLAWLIAVCIFSASSLKKNLLIRTQLLGIRILWLLRQKALIGFKLIINLCWHLWVLNIPCVTTNLTGFSKSLLLQEPYDDI